MRSGTDLEQEGLARNGCSNSSLRFSVGLRAGLCAGRSRPNSSEYAQSHAGTARGLPQTVATKLESLNWLNVFASFSIKKTLHRYQMT